MVPRLLLFPALMLCSALTFAETITCLGRIEPLDGVRTLAGPSGMAGNKSVLYELRVEEGDWVEEGQILALLDGYPLHRAEVARHEEQLEEAEVALSRLKSLSSSQATSRAKLDEASYKVSALRAEKGVYQARLEMARIRAPQRGQVLKIYSRKGERVGPQGVLELGETDKMTVVAEVYETDIHRVAVGQKATIRSPALTSPATGVVSKVGLRVGKMDVLSSDPVADTDARVVETTILMDDPVPMQRLTNLQVDVEIQP